MTAQACQAQNDRVAFAGHVNRLVFATPARGNICANKKGPQTGPFSALFFLSLSDWPTYGRTLGQRGPPVNSEKGPNRSNYSKRFGRGASRAKKNRADAARPVNREEDHAHWVEPQAAYH